MKLKNTFKRIIGKAGKKILELLIYFDQKKIGKCEVYFNNNKTIVNIYVTQKGLYKGKRNYYKHMIFKKPSIDNAEVNYILDGLDINKQLSIANWDSNVIIKNCYINAPIEFSSASIEFENNMYSKRNIKDYTDTSIGGVSSYVKFKNENIDNKNAIISFKTGKFEIENSDLNIDDISLDTKYFIVKNSDMKLNQLEILNNEVSYFKSSKIHSNLIEVITKKFINKNSKIFANSLSYNGKVINNGELLKVSTDSNKSVRNLRAVITNKLYALKERLDEEKNSIMKKVETNVKNSKVKKFVK